MPPPTIPPVSACSTVLLSRSSYGELEDASSKLRLEMSNNFVYPATMVPILTWADDQDTTTMSLEDDLNISEYWMSVLGSKPASPSFRKLPVTAASSESRLGYPSSSTTNYLPNFSKPGGTLSQSLSCRHDHDHKRPPSPDHCSTKSKSKRRSSIQEVFERRSMENEWHANPPSCWKSPTSERSPSPSLVDEDMSMGYISDESFELDTSCYCTGEDGGDRTLGANFSDSALDFMDSESEDTRWMSMSSGMNSPMDMSSTGSLPPTQASELEKAHCSKDTVEFKRPFDPPSTSGISHTKFREPSYASSLYDPWPAAPTFHRHSRKTSSKSSFSSLPKSMSSIRDISISQNQSSSPSASSELATSLEPSQAAGLVDLLSLHEAITSKLITSFNVRTRTAQPPPSENHDHGPSPVPSTIPSIHGSMDSDWDSRSACSTSASASSPRIQVSSLLCQLKIDRQAAKDWEGERERQRRWEDMLRSNIKVPRPVRHQDWDYSLISSWYDSDSEGRGSFIPKATT
jgi:hypothetical protein